MAPKRRAEAGDRTGEALLEWLAADGSRMRRPIIDVDGAISLGFTTAVQKSLEGKL